MQINSDLTPYHWNNNLDWYQDEFEFVLIDRHAPPVSLIDEAKLIQRFGPPADSFDCSNTTIHVYNRPEDVLFQKKLANPNRWGFV